MQHCTDAGLLTLICASHCPFLQTMNVVCNVVYNDPSILFLFLFLFLTKRNICSWCLEPVISVSLLCLASMLPWRKSGQEYLLGGKNMVSGPTEILLSFHWIVSACYYQQPRQLYYKTWKKVTIIKTDFIYKAPVNSHLSWPSHWRLSRDSLKGPLTESHGSIVHAVPFPGIYSGLLINEDRQGGYYQTNDSS